MDPQNTMERPKREAPVEEPNRGIDDEEIPMEVAGPDMEENFEIDGDNADNAEPEEALMNPKDLGTEKKVSRNLVENPEKI